MRVKIVLLTSLFTSNIGEWVYFIALNLYVLSLTDSAMAVSVLYVLAPLAMLVTNSWAGSFIDRIYVQRLLIVLNAMRAILVFSLVFSSNIFLIYGLSFLLQMANALYATSSFVYIARIIPTPERQRFNAWKSMAQSSGFILGPAIAGLLFMIGSVQFAILINAVILVFATVLSLLLPQIQPLNEKGIDSLQVLKEDWQSVWAYSKIHRFIVSLCLLYGLYIVVITAIDSLEAAFALQVLGLDEASYGMLVSIAGVGFIIGSAINIKWSMPPLTAIIGGMLITGIGYIIYSVSTTFMVAAIGFLILSAALTFINVGYTTFIQKNIPENLIGRFVSIYSMIEAFALLVLIIVFGLLAEILSVKLLVQSGAIILIVIVLTLLFTNRNVLNKN